MILPGSTTSPDMADNGQKLFNAAATGDLDKLKALLDSGTDVNYHQDVDGIKGWTPLMIAAREGRTEVVRVLLERGANVEFESKNGFTALVLAAWNNHRSSISELIDAGADINQQTKTGSTALHMAAFKGFPVIVRLLLDWDADPTIVDDDGFSVLHRAARKDHQEVVKLLLQRGVDPAEEVPDGGPSILQLAKEHRARGIIDILEDWMANIAEDTSHLLPAFFAAAEYGRVREVERWLDRGVDVNATDASGGTALILGAQKGYEGLVWEVLESGAEVDHQDERGHTALWWAAWEAHIGVIESLLEKGADVELPDEESRTPLSAAAQKGWLKIVEILIQQGALADSRAKDLQGNTPFTFAAREGEIEIMKLLWEQGTWEGDGSHDLALALKWAKHEEDDEMEGLLRSWGAKEPAAVDELADSLEKAALEKRERRGSNITQVIDQDPVELTEWLDALNGDLDVQLVQAAFTGMLPKARRLVRLGASVTCKTKSGRTPIFAASQGGEVDMVRWLLDQGADLRERNNRGQTPLWRAAWGGHVDVVRLLLENGARAHVDQPSVSGLTPFLAACTERHTDVARVLLDQGANLEAEDKDGDTALGWEASVKRTENETHLRFLLDRHANIEHRRKNGHTPLQLAARAGKTLTVRLLLEAGASTLPVATILVDDGVRRHDILQSNTVSPLAQASANGHEAVAELLIQAGADIDHKDELGFTPLHLASRNGQAMTVRLLIEYGANINTRSALGDTPLSDAKLGFRDTTVQILSRSSEIRTRAQAVREANSRMYQYQPLTAATSIRVVELEPGYSDDFISFDLYEVNLKDKPYFEALSYEWGERSGTIPVQCGTEGRYLLVTPNLKEILKTLRRKHEKRILWIDAICINQQDIPERNSQVSMMTDIYRSTSMVNMWLGPPTDHAETIFRLFSLFSEMYDVFAGAGDWNPLLRGQGYPDLDAKQRQRFLELWGQILKLDSPVGALRDLMQRSYFTRAWIFQELVLAHKGTMFSGPHQTGWDTVKKALWARDTSSSYFWPDLEAAFSEPIQARMLGQIVRIKNEYLEEMKFVSDAYYRGNRAKTFECWGLFQTLIKLQAGDLRDKVNAGIGVLEEKDQAALAPDYSLTTQETYIRAARYVISVTKTANKLKLWAGWNRPCQKKVLNLPSWVPDWSTPPPFRTESVGVRDVNLSGLVPGDIETSPTTLKVNAYILDRVEFKVSITMATDLYGDIVKVIAQRLARKGRSMFDTHPSFPISKLADNSLTNLEVLWYSLFGQKHNVEVYTSSVEEITSFLAWKLSTDLETPPQSRKLSDKFEKLVEKYDWDARSKSQPDFDFAICEKMESLCIVDKDLVLTDKGYMAHTGCPNTAEAGMVLAAVTGAEDVCLIKKSSNGNDAEYADWVRVGGLAELVSDLDGIEGGGKVERLVLY